MSYDFALERKLEKESPQLYRIFADNVVCCQNILVRYKSIFPSYTDHTALHSLEVIAFCNELVGSEIEKLNVDEIFILLMAAYLHDTGMGITERDYEQFLQELEEALEWKKDHPEADKATIIRRFHNDFSGCYIRKYRSFFEFPTEEHLFCVVQVSRGHRKTDLFDEVEYPAEVVLPNGNVVHLPYLAALIRLADELDIAIDRNIQFLYDITEYSRPEDILAFRKHEAIKSVSFGDACFDVVVDCSDPIVQKALDVLFEKLNRTLDQCVQVVAQRTPFTIRQTCVNIQRVNVW